MGAGQCATSSGASHNRWTEFWQWTVVAALFVGAPAHVLATGIITAAFGRMPGKALCHLRVVTPDGSTAKANRMVMRALIELPGLALCFIGYFAALFDSRRRGLHDRLAGTQVIADPPDR